MFRHVTKCHEIKRVLTQIHWSKLKISPSRSRWSLRETRMGTSYHIRCEHQINGGSLHYANQIFQSRKYSCLRIPVLLTYLARPVLQSLNNFLGHRCPWLFKTDTRKIRGKREMKKKKKQYAHNASVITLSRNFIVPKYRFCAQLFEGAQSFAILKSNEYLPTLKNV